MRGTANGFDMGGARLSGLADGGIYRGSTDAVTGNQLWDVYRNMDDLREDINHRRSARGGAVGTSPDRL